MRIVKATIGTPIRVPESHGDLWTSAWADDGKLYTASDDTTGFGRAVSSNLALSRIDGDDPRVLHGVTINGMPEYGSWGEISPIDHAFWKADGLTSVDGVLYMTVSRHSGYMDCDFPHQEAFDSSIISSSDHGAAWSAPPAFGASMFPGPSFATPFFVDFGRDYSDAIDEYVCAVSSDGAWNNGSSMRLGRVPRDRIGRLDATDWEFIQDVDHHADAEPIWGPRHETARSTFRAAGRTSMTGIHYIEPLGIYVLPQWHYPEIGTPDHGWAVTRWELYQARHPWGPWELFHTQDWSPSALYNPWIVSRFSSDDRTRLWIFAAGDWRTCLNPEDSRHYMLHVVPLELEIDRAGVLPTGKSAAAKVERSVMQRLVDGAAAPSAAGSMS
jgi:hypothetical protein